MRQRDETIYAQLQKDFEWIRQHKDFWTCDETAEEYGSVAVTDSSIECAEQVMKRILEIGSTDDFEAPRVYPTQDGGVSLHWDNGCYIDFNDTHVSYRGFNGTYESFIVPLKENGNMVEECFDVAKDCLGRYLQKSE